MQLTLIITLCVVGLGIVVTSFTMIILFKNAILSLGLSIAALSIFIYITSILLFHQEPLDVFRLRNDYTCVSNNAEWVCYDATKTTCDEETLVCKGLEN
jgi:hypothetical protein